MRFSIDCSDLTCKIHSCSAQWRASFENSRASRPSLSRSSSTGAINSLPLNVCSGTDALLGAAVRMSRDVPIPMHEELLRILAKEAQRDPVIVLVLGRFNAGKVDHHALVAIPLQLSNQFRVVPTEFLM